MTHRRSLLAAALPLLAMLSGVGPVAAAPQGVGGAGAGAADGPVEVPGPQVPTSVSTPVRVDSGRGTSACNETSVAISEANPMHAVAAWNDYRDGSARIGLGSSLDGGRTWSDRLLRPPLAFRSATEADPMTASDDRTGTLWAGGISFGAKGGVFVARKWAGEAEFEEPVMAFAGPGADKCLMAAGPDPASPADQTRVYVTFNQGLLVSADMGDTWSAPLPLDTGLGFVPCVGPSGTLYVAYWDTQERIQLLRSLDGGASLEPPRLIAQRMDVWGLDGTRTPGNFRVGCLPSLAVDPVSEALYCVYVDTTHQAGGEYDLDLYFTRSLDRGLTWSTPRALACGGAPFGDQFFPWIDVDRDGRVHLVHFDTGASAQSDLASQALLDARYRYSTDRGDSWSPTRLTGVSFTSADDGFGGIFLGDYLGIASAGGRTLPLYVSTRDGSADVFVSGVTHGAGTAYCLGYTCPCGNVDTRGGCGNAGADGDFATGAKLVSLGTNAVARDDLHLRASGLRPLAFGLLLASRQVISPPFGDGRRCLGGQVYRYPVRRADGAGVLAYGPYEIAARSTALPGNGAVTPGSTWHYQVWYRDVGGPCASGFNLSNGLQITWR